MGKYRRNPHHLAWLGLVGLASSLLSDQAIASTDNDQLLAMMRKLEARVEALEATNKQYRTEIAATRQQAQVANEKLKLAPTTASPARNSYASYPVKAGPIIETAPTWSGAYWGASAGGGVTKSKVTSTEQNIVNSPNTPFPGNTSGQNMVDSSGPGHRGGALIDLFAGWNFQPSRAFVAGGQLEATISDLNFNSSGTRTTTFFNASGPNALTTEDFRPQVSSNWMASALLRAGFLVDDKTLIYGLGGLTVAQFEARNLADNSLYQIEESFMAYGWTAGAGIERKLDSHWSIRGEYRYTNFGSHSSSGQFNFVGSLFPDTQTYQRQAQFDQSMQVGRIGIAYSIGVPR